MLTARLGKIEKSAVVAAFAVHFIFQANAAFHHGSRGQDFNSQQTAVVMASDHPWWFLTRVNMIMPDPPLYYVACGLVLNLTRAIHYLEVIALFSALVNMLAFLLLYQLMRYLIASAALRTSCLIFLLFLPCLMIQGVVLAADAAMFPIFILLLYFFFKLTRTNSEQRQRLYIAGILIMLAMAVFTKSTFVSQMLAAVVGFAILWQHGFLRKRLAVGAMGLTGLLLLIGILITLQYVRAFGLHDRFFSMSIRDIVFFHKADPHIFRAPSYDEPVRGPHAAPYSPYELEQQHKYSYPALLHLSTFTDILNIYQYDPTDSIFGERSASNASRMRFAVKSGLLFSLAFLILTPVALFRALYGSVIQRNPRHAFWSIVAVCALGWFLNIVVFLPDVPAYLGGFWLPRYIIPALICFIALSAWEVDRRLSSRSGAWGIVICLLVVFQSLIHLSFLWPWGVMQCAGSISQ
jgi:4-amino-4-deoxy-L-arabinose transferase-like glycosyltransferase